MAISVGLCFHSAMARVLQTHRAPSDQTVWIALDKISFHNLVVRCTVRLPFDRESVSSIGSRNRERSKRGLWTPVLLCTPFRQSLEDNG
jgi:hypothetical protein